MMMILCRPKMQKASMILLLCMMLFAILYNVVVISDGTPDGTPDEQSHDQIGAVAAKTNKQRLLRGGTYSRGSSGFSHSTYHSSSSSSYHSSPTTYHSSYSSPTYSHHSTNTYVNTQPTTTHHYYSNYNGTSTIGGFVVMIVFFAFLFCICICCVLSGGIFHCCPCLAAICCCCCGGGLAAAANTTAEEVKSFRREEQHEYHYDTFHHQSSPSSSAYDRNPAFEECARRAKSEVENATTTMSQQQLVPPYSGPYKTSYVDETTGTLHNATLNLNFTPDFRGNGYKLSGEGNDIDGNTVIEDGHVNYDGTAWWRERTITKDIGLIVLSRGTFDFSKRIFNGTWLASTMEDGAYIIFEASISNNNTDDGLYDEIPTATAVQVLNYDHDTSPYAPAVPVIPSAPPEPKS